jgi:threonine synthase
MRYISTRGAAPALDFEEALLAGLAADGGLYLPESWPQLDRDQFRRLAGLPYAEAAAAVMAPFVGPALAEDELGRLAQEAYAGFDHRAVAPLVQLGPADWLLELFHGPTLAFKDYALQLVGRLFDHVLERRGETVTIVGATSGDTGSAAIEACRDRARIRVFILHPKGRVSEVQRRQMTTVLADNVCNIAIMGSFDDCQDLVKAMFADRRFRDEMRLGAVNSINWARVMAQIVYYVTAGVALGAPDRSVAFAVPTGNFGNVFAGYAASRMGLPVAKLVVGSNRNDILTRFFRTGAMAAGEVHATVSPSMDIQISSNFERLLFELMDRDGSAVADLMGRFRREGTLRLDPSRWRRATTLFDAARFDDEETLAAIARVRRETGLLLDPHSAIGVAAGAACRPDASVPVIALATAHPAKFPEAVERATGTRPALPPRLADLHRRPERMTVLPNDLAAVEAFIRGTIAEAAA